MSSRSVYFLRFARVVDTDRATGDQKQVAWCSIYRNSKLFFVFWNLYQRHSIVTY